MQGSEAGVIKILTVVGARPNFMKAAPIIAAINEHNRRLLANTADRPEPQVEAIRHILVHTGQHYDELMSGSFFSDLNLPKPDIQLGVGSGSHAVQTAEIMKKFDEVLLGEKPEVVVVVGDVNSTLACALVTSKISFDSDGSSYLDFLCLMKHASLVVTDSGGIQEETTILGTPCVTVRENMERPVTVKSGTNTIAGTKTDAIKDAIRS